MESEKEPWGQSISLIPVCLDPAKLSLKSGIAEVNMVHLYSGHGGGVLATEKIRLHEARKKTIAAQRSSRSPQTQVDGVRPVCHRPCRLDRHVLVTGRAESRCIKYVKGKGKSDEQRKTIHCA